MAKLEYSYHIHQALLLNVEVMRWLRENHKLLDLEHTSVTKNMIIWGFLSLFSFFSQYVASAFYFTSYIVLSIFFVFLICIGIFFLFLPSSMMLLRLACGDSGPFWHCSLR